MSTIRIKGITYEVLKQHTPETMEREGCPLVAANMRQLGQDAHLFLRRPRGRRHYFAVRFDSGVYSNPVTVAI